jgi:hypothetical protein
MGLIEIDQLSAGTEGILFFYPIPWLRFADQAADDAS